MEITPKKFLLSIILIYITFLGIVNLQVDHYNFEGGLYKYRYISITEDHDFNLINNTKNHFDQILTPTDNVADMHDMGAPIFWAFISDWYHTYFPELSPLRLSDQSYLHDETLITAAIHLFLLLTLAFLFIKMEVIKKENKFLLIMVALSIGLYDYLSDQFFNADIMALFFMGLLITHIKKNTLSDKKDVYLMALMMGILRVVKISSIIYLPAILLILYFQKNSYKHFFKSLVRFSMTYSLFILITEVNFYTTLGTWSFLQGYGYPYSFEYLLNLHGWKASYLFPRGILLHTPILLFSLYPIGLIIRKAYQQRSIQRLLQEERIMLFMSLFMLIKLSLGLFSITAHYLGIGARQFFIDYALLCLLFQYAYTNSKKVTLALLAISLLAISFYTVSWFTLQKDFETFAIESPLSLEQWFNTFSSLYIEFIPFLKRYTLSLVEHLDLFILISFLSLLFYFFIITFKKTTLRFYNISFLSIIIFGYSLINLTQNISNTDQFMAKSGHSSYILSKGGPLYMHHELLSGLILAREYEAQHGNKQSRLFLKGLSNKIKKDLIQDIGYIGPEVKNQSLGSDLMDQSPYEIESIKLPKN